MEAYALSGTPSPSDRQSIGEPEDLDLEDWGLADPDMCFAGGNRQDNELLKLGRKAIYRLKKILGLG